MKQLFWQDKVSWISSLILCVLALIPQQVYRFIFGNEFGYVRTLIIYLFPGILAISFSNLYEQYFSGKGELKVIRNKSLFGLAATVILLTLLIKKYQLTGVCITLNISYIISSVYLWLSFRNGAVLDKKIDRAESMKL